MAQFKVWIDGDDEPAAPNFGDVSAELAAERWVVARCHADLANASATEDVRVRDESGVLYDFTVAVEIDITASAFENSRTSADTDKGGA